MLFKVAFSGQIQCKSINGNLTETDIKILTVTPNSSQTDTFTEVLNNHESVVMFERILKIAF